MTNLFKQLLISAAIFIYALPINAQAPRSYTSSEILLQLKKLNTVGSVLYIAAHPDDENTRLIAYLANEKCLRTGYLSLTRGDGGQNLIGPEQGVELGVIRTQELLAARRVDGGEQFFTRAYDFGYSKTHEETFRKWNKDSILSDMVWVIRYFRPDIIITRFATDGSGGHGHHTASAILAEEAFDAAGDPKRFPEQLAFVEVWQPRRLFYNGTNRFRDPNADMSAFIKLDVGGYNPLLGKSYGEIAAESRSMHKSQGFGSARQRGEVLEFFKPVKGDTAGLKDIFQGMDFTWNRIKDAKKTGNLVSKIISQYRIDKPQESLTLLAELNIHFRNPETPVYLKLILQQLSMSMAGFYKEVTIHQPNYSINEKLPLVVHRLPRSIGTTSSILRDTIAYSFNDITPLYWLTKPIQQNLFQLKEKSALINNHSQPASLAVHTEVNNQFHFKQDEPIQYKWVDPEKGELYRPLVITPPVMINVNEDVLAFDKNDGKEIGITLRAGKDSVSGVLKITAPDGWGVCTWASYVGYEDPCSSPSKSFSQPFSLLKKNQEVSVLLFAVPEKAKTNSFDILKISANLEGNEYTKGIKEIKYDHIPVQTLFPEAEVKLVKLDIKRNLKRIGYIPGAGDEVQACLTQLGYEVTTLTDDKLANENLSQYEAIITGVRAYNTNEKLPSFKQKLMDYVAAGGNLIVQYNTNSWAGPLQSQVGPYPFKITRNRITDEEAKVNFELPNHPVLNTPNKITDKDFEGWIQERSIYHAGDWDKTYEAPISMADPGEKADKGALIIAKYGKGHFVYTGLVFFRELPAGIPGAYRLLVNMIELKN